MFDNRNVEDFRMSNVNGEDLMTLIYQDIGAGVIIDDGYEIRAEAKIDDAWTINTHELHFVDNGTRALVVKNDKREASLDQSQEVGFDGQCVAEYEHFLELDTETWEAVFDWDSKDHVRLNESTLTDSPVEDRCSDWDFLYYSPLTHCLLRFTDCDTVTQTPLTRHRTATTSSPADTPTPFTRFRGKAATSSGDWAARCQILVKATGPSPANIISDSATRMRRTPSCPF